MTTSEGLSVRSILRVVTVVVLSALALYLVYLLRKPIGWLFLAIFIALALAPLVGSFSRHMKRGWAIALTYVLLLGVPITIFALLVPTVVSQTVDLVEDLPQYARDLREFVDENETLSRVDRKYDVTSRLEEEAGKLPNRIGDAAGTLSDLGLGLVNSLFALVNILILSIFILAGGRGWLEAAINLRPEEERERLWRVTDRVARAVGGYVQGALTIALIAGCMTFLVLTLLGVPFAGALAIVAGLFSLIPVIGATIAAVLIALVTLFNDFPTDTIIWAIWAIVYQQIENNLIQPQIQKRTVQVQPIIVIVAVLFGSTLLGVLGAIIAIPVAASIEIVAREMVAYRREQRAAVIAAPPQPP